MPRPGLLPSLKPKSSMTCSARAGSLSALSVRKRMLPSGVVQSHGQHFFGKIAGVKQGAGFVHE